MKRILAACVLATAISACAATPHSHTDIGIARVGLTLAFSNKALESAPLPPRIIIRLIPAPPSLTQEVEPDLTPFVQLPSTPTTVPKLPTSSCPSAPVGASVPATAPLIIHHPPEPGFYREVNSGTDTVTADGFTFKFPYPPVTVMQVTNVKGSSFQEITTVTPSDVITETYQFSGAELDLVSRLENNSGAIETNTYSPPVKVYSSAGIGTTWGALGLDLPDKDVLIFQGAVRAAKVVDACGSLLDTWEVASTATQLDLGTLKTSGTTTGQTETEDVATSLGGIYAQRHVLTTSIETVKNAPATVVADVMTKLDGLTPYPTSVAALLGGK